MWRRWMAAGGEGAAGGGGIGFAGLRCSRSCAVDHISAGSNRQDDGGDAGKKKDTSLWAMLKQTVSDWSEDKAMKLSAALALYTILSMAPLLVITIKVLSLVLGPKAASSQVQQQMDLLIGSAGSQAVGDMVANASKPGAGIVATIISFVILVFSASAVFGSCRTR